jgi:hypothetical protein
MGSWSLLVVPSPKSQVQEVTPSCDTEASVNLTTSGSSPASGVARKSVLGGGLDSVVKAHNGPSVVAPLLSLDTTLQKYWMSCSSMPGS